jgi:hypothetical protein
MTQGPQQYPPQYPQYARPPPSDGLVTAGFVVALVGAVLWLIPIVGHPRARHASRRCRLMGSRGMLDPSRFQAKAVPMQVSTASYTTTVIIGIIITVVVGQLLLRAGYDFLIEVYDDRTLATSWNHLLVTLFHLIALGFLGLVSTANPFNLNGIQLIITRTGVILLTLGGVYGLTVLALVTARNRRRTDAFEDSITARYKQNRGPPAEGTPWGSSTNDPRPPPN